MDLSLCTIFDALPAPPQDGAGRTRYAVQPVPQRPGCYVARDSNSQSCLLIAVPDRTKARQSPIRLQNLDVQFDLACVVRQAGREEEGIFTVVRCRSVDHEVVRYFLSVCATVLRLFGQAPTRTEIAGAINRLAAIFQRLQKPPTRSLNGLFGELFLIRHSRDPRQAVKAWRLDDAARFDFTAGDIRLDVKTSSGRERTHTFSYDQCNPPLHTTAVAASLFVERTTSGVRLADLMNDIERVIGADTDMVVKFQDVVATTLGLRLGESLEVSFDDRLAKSTLQFFDLTDIPAIRGALPAGISDVHFRVDLSHVAHVDPVALSDRDPVLYGLLPVTD